MRRRGFPVALPLVVERCDDELPPTFMGDALFFHYGVAVLELGESGFRLEGLPSVKYPFVTGYHSYPAFGLPHFDVRIATKKKKGIFQPLFSGSRKGRFKMGIRYCSTNKFSY